MGSGECEEHYYENRRPQRGPVTHMHSEESIHVIQIWARRREEVLCVCLFMDEAKTVYECVNLFIIVAHEQHQTFYFHTLYTVKKTRKTCSSV